MLESADRLDEIDYFGKMFGYFLMTAIFISPISGVVIDKSMAFFGAGDTVNPNYGTLAVHTGLTTLFGALYSLTAYTNIPDLQVSIYLFVIGKCMKSKSLIQLLQMNFHSCNLKNRLQSIATMR